MTDKIADTVARLRLPGWQRVEGKQAYVDDAPMDAADLLEALARDLAAERDRAEKAEAERDHMIAVTSDQGAWVDRAKAAEARVSHLEASLSGGVLTKNDSLDLLQKLAAAEADRDRLAEELAEARAFITRVADVEWQADEPPGVLWCPDEDAKAYVAELEHHCNWTVKDARDLLALTKGDTP
jgi:hypothetical protein